MLTTLSRDRIVESYTNGGTKPDPILGTLIAWLCSIGSSSVSSNSPIAPAVLLADAQGRRTHTNQQWNAITRCESNPDSDADWIDFAHPEDRENVRATVIRAICSRTDFSVRVRPRWDDSRVRLFELKGTPLPSSDGEVDGFVITLEEVAEPDRIDAELLHARKMETV